MSIRPAGGLGRRSVVLHRLAVAVGDRSDDRGPDRNPCDSEDPSRATTGAVIVVAAVASLAAVGFILVQATSTKGSSQDLLAGVGVLSVALSWFTVHTVFTLRYARLYYVGPDGGVNFNQDAPPRYLDFAYLAFTIGMTFQVSDTDLQTGSIRATALRRALLSYLFGAVILATTINLISGLGSGSGGH